MDIPIVYTYLDHVQKSGHLSLFNHHIDFWQL
jgi:hypothetical protein